MSRLYKLTDSACDSFLVLVGDAQDETDAQTKWETWRDTLGNLLENPSVREVQEIFLEASSVVTDLETPVWANLIE